MKTRNFIYPHNTVVALTVFKHRQKYRILSFAWLPQNTNRVLSLFYSTWSEILDSTVPLTTS